jgi:hypothetical protein
LKTGPALAAEGRFLFATVTFSAASLALVADESPLGKRKGAEVAHENLCYFAQPAFLVWSAVSPDPGNNSNLSHNSPLVIPTEA